MLAVGSWPEGDRRGTGRDGCSPREFWQLGAGLRETGGALVEMAAAPGSFASSGETVS